MASARLALSSLSTSLSVNRPLASFSLPSSSLSFPYPTCYCSSICVSLFLPSKTRVLTSSAVAEEESVAVDDASSLLSQDSKAQVKPCQLYVCNLPRSCEIADLSEMFKPFGTVQAVEISRNPETGVSKGCGYVTMSSMNEAKAAMSTLDASDFSGREMRVRFSKDMDIRGLLPSRNVIFETPHKVYVGNLAWSTKPEDLREHFSQFGTVVSAKVLYDRKGGKSRVYGFLSFASPEELDASLSSNGMELLGRALRVRKALRDTEQRQKSIEI